MKLRRLVCSKSHAIVMGYMYAQSVTMHDAISHVSKKQGDRGGDCTKRHALKTQKIPQCTTHLNAEGNANNK